MLSVFPFFLIVLPSQCDYASVTFPSVFGDNWSAMKEQMAVVARNIKAIREENNLSQQALSERSTLDRTYIGKIEREERMPSLETIVKIAKAVDVEPYRLLQPDSFSSSDNLAGDQSDGRVLRKFNHQVKNHFQMLTSLVRREKKNTEQEDAVRTLTKITRYVSILSRIYNRIIELEQGRDGSVEMAEFLGTVLDKIEQTLFELGGNIELRRELEPDLELNTTDAVVIALIVNELVMNSFRHAFNEGESGTITVELRKEQGGAQFTLLVADDGSGKLTSDDFSNSFSGLGIVKELIAHDLRGEWAVDSGSRGSRVKVTFIRDEIVPADPETAI